MITCICENCKKEFILTPDTEDLKKEPRLTFIDIRYCESAGIYAVEIVCPYCNHCHNMKNDS